jgi:hypothetical protein
MSYHFVIGRQADVREDRNSKPSKNPAPTSPSVRTIPFEIHSRECASGFVQTGLSKLPWRSRNAQTSRLTPHGSPIRSKRFSFHMPNQGQGPPHHGLAVNLIAAVQLPSVIPNPYPTLRTVRSVMPIGSRNSSRS